MASVAGLLRSVVRRAIGSPGSCGSRTIRVAGWFPSSVLLSHGSRHNAAVALTFDDGPHPDRTPPILDILRDHNARATFFAVGKMARKHEAIVRRIVDEGHTLACHTDTHANLSEVGWRNAYDECRRGKDTLEAIAGVQVRYLRPPYGRLALSTFAVALSCRMRVTLWSMDSLDHRGWSSEELLASLRDAAPQSGDIVLLHDDMDNTVAALPDLLDDLRDRGIACVNLDELISNSARSGNT